MTDIQILSEFIAPWALPKEDIPIHLVWEPSFQFDTIQVELPPDLILNELFNVNSYDTNGQTINIQSLKSENFFGLVTSTKDLFEEHHVTRDIHVKFKKTDKVIFQKTFRANIFRPYVTVIKSPTEITITDTSRFDDLLHIKLKLTGFGKISLYNEVSTGGEFKTKPDQLFQEIIRNMLTTFNDESLDFDDKGIKINPEYLERQALEYIDKIKAGSLPSAIEEELISEFSEWVADETNRSEVMNIISKSLESLLVKSILFHLEKYPENNISMPEGKTSISLEEVTEQIRLKFRYNDALKNEYEQITININVINKTTKPLREHGIPVNIIWEIERLNPLEACD